MTSADIQRSVPGDVIPEPRTESSGDDDAQQMAKHSILSRGPYYYYRGYRYDRLADALEYARLDATKSARDSISPGRVAEFEWPTAADEERMAALCISFEDGVYRFQGHRYDRLADAVNYAELCRHRSEQR